MLTKAANPERSEANYGEPLEAVPQPSRADALSHARDSRFAVRAARVSILAVTDAAVLGLAVACAYVVWALPQRQQPVDLYLELVPLLGLFIMGYAQAGLYPGFGLGPVETLRRVSYVTGFGFLILAAFSFALQLPHLYSRVTFVLAVALSLLLVPLGRALVFHVANRWSWWAEPVVVVGTGRRAHKAVKSLQNGAELGYRPVAVLGLPGQPAPASIHGVAVAGGLEQARALAARGIQVALLEADTRLDRATLDRLQQDFRHVVLLREYDDMPVEGLQVRNLGDIVGIEYTNKLLLRENRIAKRALDVVVGSVAFVAAAPIIACAAAIVRLIDGGPVFFRQERTGLAGRPIAVPKIRTMKRDADARLSEHLAANPGLREEWESSYKLKSDPRLISVAGRLFRRFSLDELPQLWTVIKGDMSLVGPRPFPEYHLAKFSPDFLELRRRVRPGITGLWQVVVRSDGGGEEQEAYDSYYIRNWSVWLDIYILSRTLAAVASGKGAY